MMRKGIIILFAFIQLTAFGQIPLDTLDSEKGKLVLYSDRTWQLLDDLTFDGILNEKVHEMFSEDTALNFVQTWNNDVCFSSNQVNDLTKLKDTVWLCVGDSTHSKFVMPFEGVITSRYGYRRGRYHNGIDINLETGDTVLACWSGKVRYAKFNEGGFGNLVIIRHHNGLETYYAHLSKHLVAPNSEVKAGDPIGLGGNTGRSFGSHLHFEVRFYDAPMNPEEIIDVKKKSVKDQNLFVHKGLFRPGAKPSDYYQDQGDGSQVAAVSGPSSGARKYYRVRRGDTLSAIAVRNKTSITKLCKLNGIRRTSTLQIGQRLRVR
ncbi:MAG: LysM peptidoglycan-binding domain-containing protein [Bacteroidetes bacterium]|nr:MAG: LysM peptidoglycan-binding domain-containing protein [Bacteroidota bacterium]